MVPLLQHILQRIGNTSPVQDRLHYWMLWEMDDAGLQVVYDIDNHYVHRERLEAVAQGYLHFPRRSRMASGPMTAPSQI